MAVLLANGGSVSRARPQQAFQFFDRGARRRVQMGHDATRLYAGPSWRPLASDLSRAIFRRYAWRAGMSDAATVESAVFEILKDVSRRPIEPTLTSDLVADLGFDSLQMLEIIAELEGRFDISIAPDEVAGTRTVAEIVSRIAGLVDARPSHDRPPHAS